MILIDVAMGGCIICKKLIEQEPLFSLKTIPGCILSYIQPPLPWVPEGSSEWGRLETACEKLLTPRVSQADRLQLFKEQITLSSG